MRFGDDFVPVLEARWRISPRLPYRNTYALKPGQHWTEAPTTEDQFEYYVELDGEVMPVGAAIARQLLAEGCTWAYFTEMCGELVVVDPTLECRPLDGRPAELIAELREANGGRLGGLPDGIGEHRDGRVIMREAKTHDRAFPEAINAGIDGGGSPGALTSCDILAMVRSRHASIAATRRARWS